MSRVNAWLDNFVTYTSANLAAHVTAQQAARSATQQKNTDRTAAVDSSVLVDPREGGRVIGNPYPEPHP